MPVVFSLRMMAKNWHTSKFFTDNYEDEYGNSIEHVQQQQQLSFIQEKREVSELFLEILSKLYFLCVFFSFQPASFALSNFAQQHG